MISSIPGGVVQDGTPINVGRPWTYGSGRNLWTHPMSLTETKWKENLLHARKSVQLWLASRLERWLVPIGSRMTMVFCHLDDPERIERSR